MCDAEDVVNLPVIGDIKSICEAADTFNNLEAACILLAELLIRG